MGVAKSDPKLHVHQDQRNTAVDDVLPTMDELSGNTLLTVLLKLPD